MTVTITGGALTLDEVVRVARGGERVEIATEAVEQMRRGRDVVERSLAEGSAVYGLTTGIGVHKRETVKADDLARFNQRLILEHRVGQGAAAPQDVVRAMTLRMANGFARGSSGVRVELAERVVAALNDGVVPHVRILGSYGQADLPANADLAHGLLGTFELAAKEGLALLNHNSFSTALAALAVADARRLLDALEVAGALDLEAFAANPSVLDASVAVHRPYPGLRDALTHVRTLLEGSYLWDAPARNLQDPLVFRTLPQVQGAARDALTYAESQLAIELNASQENPLVVADEDRIISVGNFDVLPLAAAIDFLRIALAPAITSASERAVKMLQAPLTGLTAGIAAESGLAESAMSEFGVPLQSIAAEARLLAQPVSIEHGSSMHHEGIEDRITMAPLAGRRLAEQVSLGERIVAIELAIAAQAIDARGCPQLGSGTSAAYARVRALIPGTTRGEPPPQDLEPLVELVRSGLTSPRP
jgi:histidine ammonia-lyase